MSHIVLPFIKYDVHAPGHRTQCAVDQEAEGAIVGKLNAGSEFFIGSHTAALAILLPMRWF